MSADETILILITCPDKDADALAEALVSQRLAACVNTLPGVKSTYHWRGAVERSTESLLLVKSTRSNYENLQAVTLEHHSYDVPEIIAINIETGLPDYLKWIVDSVTQQ